MDTSSLSHEKWALLTGCPNGFAPSIAKALALSDFNIILHGRNEQGILSLKVELQKKFPLLQFVSLIYKIERVADASIVVSQISQITRHLNVIVHHLGGTLGVRSSLACTDEWIQVLLQNCLFSFEVNRLLVPILKEQLLARIINVGSVSATALRGSAPYACAKALLLAYTKTLGRELASSTIGVSYISLGAFETINSNWARYKQTDPDLVADFLRHHQACGRLGQPDEIIPVIQMLIDSNYTFGQGVVVEYDGGTM